MSAKIRVFYFANQTRNPGQNWLNTFILDDGQVKDFETMSLSRLLNLNGSISATVFGSTTSIFVRDTANTIHEVTKSGLDTFAYRSAIPGASTNEQIAAVTFPDEQKGRAHLSRFMQVFWNQDGSLYTAVTSDNPVRNWAVRKIADGIKGGPAAVARLREVEKTYAVVAFRNNDNKLRVLTNQETGEFTDICRRDIPMSSDPCLTILKDALHIHYRSGYPETLWWAEYDFKDVWGYPQNSPNGQLRDWPSTCVVDDKLYCFSQDENSRLNYQIFEAGEWRRDRIYPSLPDQMDYRMWYGPCAIPIV